MIVRFLLLSMTSLLLGACGFHLRALQQEFPFASVAVSGDSALARQLRQQLEHLQGTKLNASANQADATIVIVRENNEKRISALTRGGKVAEYQLRYVVEFSVNNAYGESLQEPAQIDIRRDFPYDDQQTLSKESEEKKLMDDMRTQAVETIFRRISALHGQPLKAPSQ